MHEIKFGPSLVVPRGPANLPRRWGADHEPLGVGGVYCSCKRQITGSIKFINFEDAELLKLPDLRTMCLEKEPDNA